MPDSASAQDLDLTNVANPTTYTAIGQTIHFTYTITANTDFFSSGFIDIHDDIAPGPDHIACSLTMPFNTGETQQCETDHTITEADITAGSFSNAMFAVSNRCGEGECTTFTSASVTAGATFVATPKWKLTKAANPTTYSAAGQNIHYTYVLTNTGNVDITLNSLIDDKAGAATCQSTSLPVGANTTCDADYTTTADDVGEGSVTNIATATGTPASGTLAPATAQATIRFRAPPTGSITIVKTATGGNATFGFTSTVPGAASFTLTTSSGQASRAFPGLTPATYTFTEVNLPAKWKLVTLSCVGDTGGTPTTIDLVNKTVSVGLNSGEAITCTFADRFEDVDDTTTKIASFLLHRLTLLEDGPDRTRIFRRIPGALWGNTGESGNVGISGGPIAFTGSGEDGALQMSAATSLLQLSEAYAQASGRQLPMPSVDVWIETHYSEFEDDASKQDSDGHFSVTYLGADYLVTPSVLLGALAQFDWTDQNTNNGSSADGFGVMAGPYISARLAPNLFFTARTAYGVSENSINPFGTYEDDFSTDRWLASAQLTGNWNFGNWRVTPTAEFTFMEENQHSYTDSRGKHIPDQEVSVGRVSLGPEFAYRYLTESGIALEPQFSVTGLWDFQNADAANISDFVTTDEDIRAMVKAGLMAQLLGGASMRLVGTVDGVGSDGYDSFGGQAWLNIPLQ